MPSSSSHAVSSSPSLLLALVCLAIVKAFDPSWVAHPVSDLAAEMGIRPERVSRLWRALHPSMEELLEEASTRGRKASPPPDEKELRGIQAEALLDVTRETIRMEGVRKPQTQTFVVAARERMKEEEGVSYQDFAAAVGVSERTVRSWAERETPPPESPTPNPMPRKRRSRGEGRFDLSVTLPHLQVVGDTTQLEVFGIPLKVVAFQDPGDRHLTPWKSFLVESTENQEIILKALKAAVGDLSGIQAMVDHGSPYLAERVKSACEKLGLLHEPQKEGTPTEKSPLERGYGVMKHFLGPVFGLTKELAEAFPVLKNVDLAKTTGRLLLDTWLRVYNSAAAVRETNRPDDPEVLEEVAKAQRERAVAENRSRKLKLGEIFDRYEFEGQKIKFIRAHRRRHLKDIEDAEQRFAAVDPGKIRNGSRYFTAILMNLEKERAEGRKREAWQRRRAAEERALRRQQQHRAEEHERIFSEHPEKRVLQGLREIAAHYTPQHDALFNDGVGHGTREVREGLRLLFEQSGTAAVDRATLAWDAFEHTAATPAATPLVRPLFEALLAAARKENASPDTPSSATLSPGSNPQQDRRPPPRTDLRF